MFHEHVSRRTKRIGLAACVLTALVGLVVWTLSGPIVVRHLEAGGVVHAIPIPPPALQIEAAPGRAVFFVIGDRDLAALFGEHGRASGWRFAEQMGSAYRLDKPGFQLHVTRRQWATSFFVLVGAEVVPVPP